MLNGYPENLTELKRHAKEYIFTMVQHSYTPAGNKLIDKPRKVKTLQTNALQFEPIDNTSQGSWLTFDSAKRYRFNGSFIIIDLDDGIPFHETMTYELNRIGV